MRFTGSIGKLNRIKISSNANNSNNEITSIGELWGFGENPDSLIAVGSNPLPTATQTGLDADWTAFDVGFTHAIALKSNGTLWGRGDNSRLAAGGSTTLPDFTVWTQTGSESNWVKIVTGIQTNYAIKSDGTIWGWGRAILNSLGTIATNTGTPTQLETDSDWMEVGACNSAAIAIKTDGTIWGLGSGTNQKLGPGTTNRSTWTQIGSDTDWSKVKAGANGQFFILQKNNGTLWGIGGNSTGQLGTDATITPTTGIPIQIGSDSDWVNFAAGGATSSSNDAGGHCLAIKSNGSLWGWGSDANNRLAGTGTGPTIRQLGVETNWIDVGCGLTHSMIINNLGELWGVGENNVSQVINSATNPITSLTLSDNSKNWKRIVCGLRTNFILT